MAVPCDKPMTLEDLYELPDDENRYELVRGRLVAEPPPGFYHGRLVAAVVHALSVYAAQERNGLVLTGDAGFVLARDPDTVRAPDVAFVRRERCEDRVDEPRAFMGEPDLAVEVLSPGDRPGAVTEKVSDYFDAGVHAVWLIFPEAREVRVCTPDGVQVLGMADTLTCPGLLPGFSAPVAALFRTPWSY